MNKNLANVGLALVVLSGGMALGMMWGTRLSGYVAVPELAQFAITARPVVSLLVVVGCSLGLFVRPARQSALALGAIAGSLLLITAVYAYFVWVPHGFFPHPVG